MKNKYCFIIVLLWAFFLATSNIVNAASWQAELTAVGRNDSVVLPATISKVKIGVDSTASIGDSPGPPPSYSVDLELYNDDGALLKDIRASGAEQYTWLLGLNPHGSFGPAMTNYPATLSWIPSELGAGNFQLLDENGAVVIEDMKATTSIVVTARNEKLFSIVYTVGIDPPASISGTVNTSQASGTGTLRVGAWVAGGLDGNDSPVAVVEANDSGFYKFASLTAGSYDIGAFRDMDGGYTGYTTEVALDIDDNESKGVYTTNSDFSPTAVTVGSGGTVTGKDFAIFDWPYINGTINIERDNFPLSGVPSPIPGGESVNIQVPVGILPGVTTISSVRVVRGDINCNDSLNDTGVLPDEIASDGIYSGWACQQGANNVPNGNYEIFITTNKGITEDTSAYLDGTELPLPTIVSIPDRIRTRTPIFELQAAVEGANSSAYGLVILNTNDSIQWSNIQFETDGFSYPSYSLTTQNLNLVNGQTYFWFAGATDNSGHNNSHSALDKFTFDNESPYTTPTLFPNSNFVSEKYYYKNDFTQTLTTNGLNSGEAGTVSYQINSGAWSTNASPAVVTFPTTEGEYVLSYKSTDFAGNNESVQTLTFVLDKTVPAVDQAPTPGTGTSGSATDVSLGFSDANGVTIYHYLYDHDPGTVTVLNDSKTTTIASSVTVTIPAVDGQKKDYWLAYYAEDLAGNKTSIQVLAYSISTQIPVTALYLYSHGNSAYFNGSGYYKYGGVSDYPASDIINKVDGNYPPYYYIGTDSGAYMTVIDFKSNIANSSTFFSLCNDSRITTCPYPATNFFGGPPPTTYMSPASAYYNNAFSLPYYPNTVDQEFHYLMKFYSSAYGHNESVQQIHLYIDNKVSNVDITYPVGNATRTNDSITITGTASETSSGSGIAKIMVSLDGGVNWYNDSSLSCTDSTNTDCTWSRPDTTLAQGANAIRVKAKDKAGNVSSVLSGSTLTYYPPLSLTVDGNPVAAGGNIYVPLNGNKVKTIVVAGGTGTLANYSWTLSPVNDSIGVLNAANGVTTNTYTAQTATGVQDLTIVDDFNTSLYNITIHVNAVLLDIQGVEHIAHAGTGTVQHFTVAGHNGAVEWSIDNDSIATLNASNPDDVTLTTIKSGRVTITATDSVGATIQKTVNVVNQIVVTEPALAMIDTSTMTFSVSGGSGGNVNTNYTWSLSNDSYGTISAAGVFTPESAKNGVRTVRATATDITYGDVSGTSVAITLTDPLVLTGQPSQNAMKAGATNAFGFTGGTGQVNWTYSSGNIDANGQFTAPTLGVGELSRVVTISAADPGFPDIIKTGDYQLTVYPPLTIKVGGTLVNDGGDIYVPNKSGNNTKLITVSGGRGISGNYTWGLTTTAFGNLNRTTGNDSLFTAVVDAKGNLQLTVTDSFASDIYTITVNIRVVELNITGDDHIVHAGAGTLSLFTVEQNTGLVTWRIDDPTVVTLTVNDSVTNRTKATLLTKKAGEVTITANDSNTGAKTQKTVKVVNQIVVTNPAPAMTDIGTMTFTVTGGTGNDSNTNYTWSLNDSLGVITPDGIFTPYEANSGVRTIKATATDKVYTEVSGTHVTAVTITDPLMITAKPVGDAMQHGKTFDFNFSGGTNANKVTWTASSGTFSETPDGLFTAPTLGATESYRDVTVSAKDLNFPVQIQSLPYTFRVYKTVTITNKPTTIPVVEAGLSSMAFTVAGGTGNYTWSVKGPDSSVISADTYPVFGKDGPSFRFTAPRLYDFLKNGFKAGLYTVLVKDTDNSGFNDSFQVYVPIKLIAVKTADGAQVMPEDVISPVFVTSTVNKYKLYAAGGATSVNAVFVPVSSTADIVVADNDTKGQNPFKVWASAPGAAVVTVRDVADTAGNYKGSLRVEVIGSSTAIGTVTNYPTDFINPNDITIQLLDSTTKKALPVPKSVTPGVDGSFTFNDMRWGSYWARIGVRDNDSQYAPFMEEARVMINQAGDVNLNLQTGIFNLSGDLKRIINTYRLEVALKGIKYNDSFGYKLIDVNSNAVVRSNDSVASTANNDSLRLNGLNAAEYRLFIQSRGYTPLSRYTQNNIETGVIRVNDAVALITNDSKTVKATGTLVPNVTFVPDPARVNVSHIFSNGGFDLRIVKNNFKGAFSMEIAGNIGAVIPDSGSGNDSAPYLLNWDSTDLFTSSQANTPSTGDTTFVIEFIFKDGAQQVGTKYIVTYVEFANATNKEIAKGNDSAYQDERDLKDASKDTDDIKDEYTGETLFVILGEREFFPLDGTSFDVTLKDATGADTPVTVEIPPLPLEYLLIDDSSDGVNGLLLYDSVTDKYDVATDSSALHVQEDDILRVEVNYYTFGGEAIGNGVSIELRLTDGDGDPTNDKLVRFNPILAKLDVDGADLRKGVNDASGAPVVTLPLLLNPNSSFFAAFKKLSESKAKIKVLVSEKGDGKKGFHIETLDPVVQDDGLVLIDTNHLSSWGLGTGDDSSNPLSEPGTNCFIATAAYGSQLEPHVVTLRQFRDEYLLTNAPGQAFVATYYRYSPPLASYIAEHDDLRQAVRVALTPLVGISWVALHTTLVQKLLLLTIMMAAFFGGGVMVRRRRQ